MPKDVGSVGRGWVAVLALVSALVAPAVGEDKSAASDPGSAPCFFDEGLDGALVLRPAAAARRAWAQGLGPLITRGFGGDFVEAQRRLMVEPEKEGRLILEGKDIEWVAGRPCFTPTFLKLESMVVRTVAPFDWLKYLAQFEVITTEAREAGHSYYVTTAPLTSKVATQKNPFFHLDPDTKHCVYLVDDRTAWFGSEETVKKFLNRKDSAAPKLLMGTDWERARAGLFAVVLDIQKGSLLKSFEAQKSWYAFGSSLFKDVERVALSLSDGDGPACKLWVDCPPGDASAGISRMLEFFTKYMLAQLEDDLAEDPKAGGVTFAKVAKELLENARIEHTAHTVTLRTVATSVAKPATQQAKADAKTEKR